LKKHDINEIINIPNIPKIVNILLDGAQWQRAFRRPRSARPLPPRIGDDTNDTRMCYRRHAASKIHRGRLQDGPTATAAGGAAVASTSCKWRLGKARHGRARQGTAKQSKAKQSKAKQSKSNQIKSKQN
jgi:hypothetical protein